MFGKIEIAGTGRAGGSGRDGGFKYRVLSLELPAAYTLNILGPVYYSKTKVLIFFLKTHEQLTPKDFSTGLSWTLIIHFFFKIMYEFFLR